MSVQAGIWNFDGKPVGSKLLADFSEALKQQGPDGEGLYLDGPVALLYRPFHTTAESRGERQPYVTRRGFVLTWDGRLDNREELMADVRDDVRADTPDAAIIAALFDRWETECFRRIRGDWAISIWRPPGELILAIDFIAIRHIFYYLKKEQIYWSTDLAPIVLLSGDKFHIDDRYIAGYFAHDPDAHLTAYREIREVPPGQFVRIRNGIASGERYWRFSPKSRIRYKTDGEYEEHFRHVLRRAVHCRLRSDTPILAELSGGLDSSSIVCVADDILAKEGAQTPRLDTLSYYDKTEPNADDWIYSRQIEDKRGRAGTHINASNVGSCASSLECPEFAPLPGFVWAGRELMAERATIVRCGGYRAVLSGIGGDEFMGGIPNPAYLADLIVQLKVVTLARQLTAWSLAKRVPWIQLLWKSAIDLLPPSLGQYLHKQAKVAPWIDKDFAKRGRIALRQLDVDEHFGLWMPSRRSFVGGMVLMGNKLAKLKSQGRVPEETRYPYLDQNLVEFILSIPASQVLRPGERRSLMRRSLRGLVPDEILSRRTKQFGARTPVLALERNWGQLRSVFNSSVSSRLGYINQHRFLENLQDALGGKEIHIVRMLRTISLEFWLRDVTARGLVDGDACQRQAPVSVSR